MRSYLCFAAFALCWALRFLFEGIHSRPITFLFPDLSYELISRIEVVAAAPTSWLLLLFVYTLFPAEALRGWTKVAFLGSMGILPASVFSPVEHLAAILLLFQIMSFLLVFPLYATLAKAIRRGRDGALLVSCGIVLFTCAAVNDTLYSLRIIDTAYTISIGIVVLTLFFSAVLSRRFAHAYSAAKRLSRELNEKNRSLEQLDKLKDEFIANTSHELRTPLQGIVGLAEGLSHTLSPASGSNLETGLSLIAASGRRLAHLINDIQDFSRIKHKGITLAKHAVDIRALVSTVLALAAHLRRSDSVTLDNALPEEFPSVHGDEERLEQIFYNIVGNAIKYTPSGRITVSGHTDGAMAVITVEDTGIGIREERLATLFVPYTQAGSDSEQQAGTGIGLSITRYLVELHGGTIAAQSRYGEGSRFTLTLPLAPPSCPQKAPAPLLSSVLPDVTLQGLPAQTVTNVQPKPGTILIVDDDPVNRRVFATILAERYTLVLQAGDGVEALEIIENRQVDLVLLDIMMPRLDGYATLERIRKKHSPLELPVLLLTARNRSRDLVAGFRAGANDYLTKPCGCEELCARVESQMRIRKIAALKQENQALAAIIETERRLQQESLTALQRLESMLDVSSDPVALIDETHTITFANRAFYLMAKCDPGAACGMRADAILAESGIIECLDSAFSAGSGNRQAIRIEVRIDGTVHLLALSLVTAGDESLALLTTATSGGAEAAGPNGSAATGNSEAGPGARRRDCAKRAVDAAIRCWCESTGQSALELARSSGLWKIHMNPDGWERAKTLDRYLSASQFPKNPRVKTIIATLAFVLETLAPDSPDYEELHEHLLALQEWT
jgi:two-component system sensor histidine kinase ChiS